MTCASGTMTSVIAHPPSPLAPPVLTTPRGGENHINEITPACLAWCQAEKVIMVAPVSEMRKKSLKESGLARSVRANGDAAGLGRGGRVGSVGSGSTWAGTGRT